MSDKPFWFDEERLALQEFEMSEQSKPNESVFANLTQQQLDDLLSDGATAATRKNDALSAKCAELEISISEAQGYCEELDRKNESLRAQLSEAQGYCEELDRKNETLKREIHKMKVGQELANEHMTNLERELAEVSKRGLEWLDKCNAERSKLAELEKQLGEKDAELKDLVRLQAGEFYLVHHKSHPDPAEEFVKAFNSLRTDWLKMKAALESTASTGCYHCSGDASETLANLKYKGE